MILTLTQWVTRYRCFHQKRRSPLAGPIKIEWLEHRQVLTTADYGTCLPVSDPQPALVIDQADTDATDFGAGEHAHDENIPHATPLPKDWTPPHSRTNPRGNGTLHPLTDLPALNSNPSATVNIFLDFDGNFQDRWGSLTNISTPAFSLDKDHSTFSDLELDAIREIFARVAEDYAPFNVNVTTVEPAVIGNGNGVRVAIGGDYRDWYGSAAGGVAFVDNFTSRQENIVFVFAETLESPESIAEASSHEAGHAFGLDHQSQYSNDGRKLTEYYDGNSTGAPIMGVSYGDVRSRWWLGLSTSATTTQDDLAIISRAENGFGYRADDHGDNYSSATALTFNSNRATASGIIEQMNDVDVFRFDVTQSQQYRIDYHAALIGANLDVHFQLLKADGTVLADQTTFHNDSLAVGQVLAPGSYQVIIQSDGTYGSLGQYSLQVTAGDVTSSRPTIPGDFSGQYLSPTSAEFTWGDSLGEDHYILFATRDGDRNQDSYLISIPANSTSYTLTDKGILDGWRFELRAVNDDGSSTSPRIAPTVMPTTAPQNVRSQTFSLDSIAVFWNAAPGAMSYVVRITTAAAPNTAVQPDTVISGTRTETVLSGLRADVDYLITVTARNSLGKVSQLPIQARIAADTDPQPPLVLDPVTGSATQPFRVHLSWDKVDGATLFQIQQKQGRDWITVKVVSSETNAVDVLPDGDSTKAQFRVLASNGESTTTSKPMKVRRPLPIWRQR